MGFAPIRPDRCILLITLHADDGVTERYRQVHAVLKECRLHPLDTTPVSQIVIVEEAAFSARQDEIRALLGPQDTIHVLSKVHDRLQTRLVAPDALLKERYPRPPERRPPWLRDD